jgi:AcrR family transcriptional regulator
VAGTTVAEPEGTARRYRSPLRERRAAETRQSLLAAAARLFASNGWQGTGMRDVATEAGVATETLYAHFSSKRALLHAVVDVAVVGDDEPLAIAERPEFAAMGHGSLRERTAAGAELLTAVHVRTAAMAKVIRQAAGSDAEMAEELRATRERQRMDIAASVALILGRDATPAERDGVWAVTSPDVYCLLVDESGWTPAQYEEWMAGALERLLKPDRKRSQEKGKRR